MTRTITLYLTLLMLFLISPAGASELAGRPLEHFDFIIDNGTFNFRRIDYHNLDGDDRNTYIPHTTDHDAIKQMLGSIPAWIFWLPLKIYPSLAHELIVQQRAEDAMRANNPFVDDWFIEKDGKFVGHIGLSAIGQDIPESILNLTGDSINNILNIAISIDKEYRGQYIGTQLIPLFLRKLSELPQLDGKTIFFATRTDNYPMSKICRGMQLTSLGSATVPLNMGFMSLNTEVCFFKYKVLSSLL